MAVSIRQHVARAPCHALAGQPRFVDRPVNTCLVVAVKPRPHLLTATFSQSLAVHFPAKRVLRREMAAPAIARRCCHCFQRHNIFTWTRWSSSQCSSIDVSGLDAVVERAQAGVECAPGRGLPTLLMEDSRYRSNKHKARSCRCEPFIVRVGCLMFQWAHCWPINTSAPAQSFNLRTQCYTLGFALDVPSSMCLL